MTTDQQRVIMLPHQPSFHISKRKNGRIGLSVEAGGGFNFTGNGLSRDLLGYHSRRPSFTWNNTQTQRLSNFQQ